MSEHKNRKPGEIKGAEFKKKQREPVKARWVTVAKLGSRWPEKHLKGFVKALKKQRAADSGSNKKED